MNEVEKCFEEGRKQGALEELESKYDDELIKLLFLIRKELNERHYSNDEIDDRIKELEGDC